MPGIQHGPALPDFQHIWVAHVSIDSTLSFAMHIVTLNRGANASGERCRAGRKRLWDKMVDAAGLSANIICILPLEQKLNEGRKMWAITEQRPFTLVIAGI